MEAIITIEFLWGNDVKKSFSEAKRIATLLDITVKFNFNNVICYVNKNSNIEEEVEWYLNRLKLDN